MGPETHHHGASWSESSTMMGPSSIMPPTKTQHQLRHRLVHRHAANAATEDMAQDQYSEIVHETGGSKNGK